MTYLTNHKEIINYLWVRRFTEIEIKPDNWIYHFVAIVDTTISIEDNYEAIKNP